MTLPRRHRRSLTVAGRRYAWRVGRQQTRGVPIHITSEAGARLVVHTHGDATSSRRGRLAIVITPRSVAWWVSEALDQGWSPDERSNLELEEPASHSRDNRPYDWTQPSPAAQAATLLALLPQQGSLRMHIGEDELTLGPGAEEALRTIAAEPERDHCFTVSPYILEARPWPGAVELDFFDGEVYRPFGLRFCVSVDRLRTALDLLPPTS